VTETATRRVFAILGDPVAHSLSPCMQNAGFHAAGIDATYVALRPAADDVPMLMATLAMNGGGGNITLPFKQIAAGAPLRDERVELLGVANVFGSRDGSLAVINTDVDGILTALDVLEAPPSAWLVLGTGGSARAVIGAARERGARVAVRSRDAKRAGEFLNWAESIGVRTTDEATCEAVVNATPLGLSPGDALPLEVRAIPSLHVALDLVYRPDGPTRWVRACGDAGLRAGDGREVLLAQGTASWKLWFPGIAPPVDVMRAALHGHLG